MKKFKFNLEKLLSYKEQVLKSEMQKLSNIMADIQHQEQLIEQLKESLIVAGRELEEKLKAAVSGAECQRYQNYIENLRENIEKAKQHLEALNAEKDKQIDIIAEAKKETKSLETLKEKKYAEYVEEDRKLTELEIAEFISAKETMAEED